MSFGDNLLWLVIVWPLLLAFPAVSSRLPQPRYLSIVPALLLALWPHEASLEFSWLLFGTGLATDPDTRWMLTMSVGIWLLAAKFVRFPARNPAADRETTLFALTLAGNLGAILATELVGFFSFSTLMGYALYGLLVDRGDEGAMRAGRRYLMFLIAADLALFEALLLAAAATGDLRFGTVGRVMAGADSASLYASMVFAGFALRAGVWPAHSWLTANFGSAPRSALLLLCGAPVATGLLGATRWLPLGQSASYFLGTGVQFIGGIAVIYAMLKAFQKGPLKMLSAWGAVAAGGVFSAALGTGMAHPAIWREYQFLAHPLIASMGLGLALLVVAIGWIEDRRPQPAGAPQPVSAANSRARAQAGRRWTTDGLRGLQSYSIGYWIRLRKTMPLARIRQWDTLLDAAERQLRRWPVAITLLSLLAISAALLELG